MLPGESVSHVGGHGVCMATGSERFVALWERGPLRVWGA